MVLMLLYLLLGAQIFSSWEGWTYVGSVYFSFVTLATIGFGDLVPGNRSVGTPNGTACAKSQITYIIYMHIIKSTIRV